MLRPAGLISAVVIWVCSSACLLAADDPATKAAVDLFPAGTIAYVEIGSPGKLADTLLDHPLTKQLQAAPEFKAALQTPDMQQVQAVVKVIEEKLGTEWRPAVSSLTGDGIYFGIEPATQGVIVLVKARDEKLLAKARETFIELARQDAKDNGREDPVKESSYHGVALYKLDQVQYGMIGPWMVLSNKLRLCQMVIDNATEAGRQTLGSEEQFKQAYKLKNAKDTAWGYFDLRIVRATGVAKTLLSQKSDNPALELLVGGILEAVPNAPYVTASVSVDSERVAIAAAVPYESKTVGKTREFYFGPGGKGDAPPLLAPRETILSLSTYRDFGLMWKLAPDLFDDNINAKFAEAESGLATIFSGRSFPDDILANLEPGVQLVVARQTFGKDDITPTIKLPALATVFRMKKPQETTRQFKITYQSLIGFLNIVNGQNKLEAVELDTEKLGNILLVSAKYLPPEKKETHQAAGIHFNASPSVAFVGDKFILASTRGLALELAQQFEKNSAAPSAGVNTQLLVDGKVLRQVLSDNRTQLVAQNQEEKGHSKAEAETEIDVLLQLLSGFRETSLRLTTDHNTLGLSWEVKLGK